MATNLSHRRVIIVGAGQSGLAVAAALTAAGMRPQHEFVVVDAAASGHRSWSSRPPSMALLSDVRHSTLPVRRFPGDQRRHPRIDEVVDYLKVVEAAIGVEAVWGVRATGVTHRGDGSTLHLHTTAGDVQTRNIVCATGAAARPRVPEWAGALTAPRTVLHSSHYRRPTQIPTPDVLIVGGGNSGVQIARELSASHTVTLSVRGHRGHRHPGQYRSLAGQRTRRHGGATRAEPLFGDSYTHLKNAGVRIAPEVTGASADRVMFADNSHASPGSVIFATGYQPGDDWLPETARTSQARRTATGMPGLFVAGFPQYSRRGADTLAGVWNDALAITRQITTRP